MSDPDIIGLLETLDSLRSVVARQQEQIARLEEERDKLWQQQEDAVGRDFDLAAKILAERDEARAERDRLIERINYYGGAARQSILTALDEQEPAGTSSE